MNDQLTFEKANDKLEKLVEKMESGELSLDESMKTYEEAFNLLSFCYEQLETYKGQIIDINSRIEEINKKEDLFND
jgi:exodeoxyribonuclease VII small subunit